MRINKAILLIIFLICSIVLTGCWNYKEVEQLAIVAGAAVDKHEDGTLHLTIEIVNIAGDGQVAYEPIYIEADGETFFEAARSAITKEGKKLYWSHAKVIIISQEIAKENIIKYLDFLFRDSETREDTWLLVSIEKTAREVLQSKGMLSSIVSFQIDNTMRSQKSISRFPYIELFEFFDRLYYKQVSPVLPIVRLVRQNDKETPSVGGTAIFKSGKMVGNLDENHTKCMLWLRDEFKGGLKIINDVAGTGDNVTLEVFKSKSKITPFFQGEELKMKVDIDLDVSIGEIAGDTDFISSAGQQILKKAAQEQIEKDIEFMYSSVRDKYNADVFGFGRRIEMHMPEVWSQIKNNWDEFFAELELDLNVDIKIRGSATTRMPLKLGE